LKPLLESPLDSLDLTPLQCEIRPSHASHPYAFPSTNPSTSPSSTPNNPTPPPLPKSLKKEKHQRGCLVKGRNEPCTIANVAFAVAGIKGVPVEEVVGWAWRNSAGMFGLGIHE